ncbi:suppressor of cytokine signaling 3-like [Clavelina lepadiformis]|uniref:SH2 domain-containing protein n=1 Tax=Clavelina lepadiformis TaxID=159417 RepID=A0ABP0F260_CLALP
MRLEDKSDFQATREQSFIPTKLKVEEKRASSCSFCVECASYYWKNLDAKGAAKILSKYPMGSFLVRPSTHPAYHYALSQKIPVLGITHIRIQQNEEGLYNMETDDSISSTRIQGFTCVLNMVESWSRVYREIGFPSLQKPVTKDSAQNVASYVNDFERNVCFHDNEEADKSVREFVMSFLKNKSIKNKAT